MKKVYVLFVIFILLSILIINNKDSNNSEEKQMELRSVFISYIELNDYISGKSYEESVSNIDKIINNIKNYKFNSIILQIRSHNDAIYQTDMFKVSDSIILNDGSNYDVLSYFQDKCNLNNIKLIVWMNPYRIGKEENISKKEWIGTNNISKVGNLYYYNPASSEVQNYMEFFLMIIFILLLI